MTGLQADHLHWVQREYPDQPTDIPAYGMVEEAGELMHALVKLKQFELWGADVRYTQAQLRAKLADAIGDCMIYVCSYLNAHKAPLTRFCELLDWATKLTSDYTEPLDAATAVVFYSAAKAPKLSVADLVMYLRATMAVASLSEIPWQDALIRTWKIVRARRRNVAQSQDTTSPESHGSVPRSARAEAGADPSSRSVDGQG